MFRKCRRPWHLTPNDRREISGHAGRIGLRKVMAHQRTHIARVFHASDESRQIHRPFSRRHHPTPCCRCLWHVRGTDCRPGRSGRLEPRFRVGEPCASGGSRLAASRTIPRRHDPTSSRILRASNAFAITLPWFRLNSKDQIELLRERQREIQLLAEGPTTRQFEPFSGWACHIFEASREPVQSVTSGASISLAACITLAKPIRRVGDSPDRGGPCCRCRTNAQSAIPASPSPGCDALADAGRKLGRQGGKAGAGEIELHRRKSVLANPVKKLAWISGRIGTGKDSRGHHNFPSTSASLTGFPVTTDCAGRHHRPHGGNFRRRSSRPGSAHRRESYRQSLRADAVEVTVSAQRAPPRCVAL